MLHSELHSAAVQVRFDPLTLFSPSLRVWTLQEDAERRAALAATEAQVASLREALAREEEARQKVGAGIAD